MGETAICDETVYDVGPSDERWHSQRLLIDKRLRSKARLESASNVKRCPKRPATDKGRPAPEVRSPLGGAWPGVKAGCTHDVDEGKNRNRHSAARHVTYIHWSACARAQVQARAHGLRAARHGGRPSAPAQARAGSREAPWSLKWQSLLTTTECESP